MNTKEDKAIRKQVLRDYLIQRIHRGEVFIRYKRTEDGRPRACFVALRDSLRLDGETPILLVGWSQCSKKDQFDRKKALRIAVSRALSGRIFLSGTGLVLTERGRLVAISTDDMLSMALDARRYFEARVRPADRKSVV